MFCTMFSHFRRTWLPKVAGTLASYNHKTGHKELSFQSFYRVQCFGFTFHWPVSIPDMEIEFPVYLLSSPLHNFNFQFLFGLASKTFTTMEKVDRRNITGSVLQIRVFKRIRYCRVA